MKFIQHTLKKYHQGTSKEYRLNAGFTLIETLVSLALFSVVLVISGGTIASVIDVNKRNQAISSVVNNLNYSIDSTIRDIKTGYLYKCDYIGQTTVAGLKADPTTASNNCSNTKNLTLVSTISGESVVVTYEFVQPDVETGANGYIQKTIYHANGQKNGTYSITDKNNVNIEVANFTVKTPDALNCKLLAACEYGQPSVFVVIKGKAGNQTVEASKFYVQTFISQRLINITDFKE